MSAQIRLSARNLYRPVRMCPVQIAVLRNAFRLEPDAKLHSKSNNTVSQLL